MGNVDAGLCVDHDVRLVDGRAPNEGRVEYCLNGHWGTICHHFWDHKAAAVVCKELDLPTEGNIQHSFHFNL